MIDDEKEEGNCGQNKQQEKLAVNMKGSYRCY